MEGEDMTQPSEPQGEGNAAQIAYWNDKAALNWLTMQTRIDAAFAPLTARALDAAAPRAGERVIDIGCGCGATTLELAGRVGPTGAVCGFDVSAPMAARARERIAEAGLVQARVEIADAAVHPFTPDHADLLFSRFGVMFFVDPVAAFANLRRAMRPGGRMLCAAWRPLEENPWFVVPFEAVRSLLPPMPPPEPDVPGPYAFGNPERVRAIMTAAGWRDVTLTRQEIAIRLAPPGQIAEATEFVMRLGALARALADAEDALRARVAEALAEVLAGHDSAEGIHLTGSIWLIAGVK
jgi:SAM-dependent methyltransferase